MQFLMAIEGSLGPLIRFKLYLNLFHPGSKRKNLSDKMLNSRETDIPFKHLESEIEFYQWLKLRLLNDTLIEIDESYNS